MTSPDHTGRHRWLFLAILLLAFALRVHRLDAQSLWYDEAVTAQVAQQGLTELARWTADDIQPPLYYGLVAGWTQLAGRSEGALRFPSVLCGCLMVALAYALGRRLFGRAAGLLAALLGALHPLWLYYSQEARMYTLLTALGLLAGCALLRILAPHRQGEKSGQERPIWWIILGAAAIGLLYTHYFAAFLLLAFAAFFLAALVIGRDVLPARRLLGRGALVALVTGLAYLPWLPNGLRRFAVDASYWQGRLKLNEALRHLAISFTTGETVLEARAAPLAWGMAALAGLCLLLLLGRALRETDPGPASGTRWLALIFVALYLVAPVAAILALAYRTPKFNPRYLMLASPGLILLLAGALAPLLRRPPALRLLSLGLIGVLLALFLHADSNWFTDPAFTKDDWRGAAAHVRSQIAEDEGVILVSGHALPAWRYYAPELAPVRLPELEILDVNAVLDLGAAQALNAGLAGQQGAWLVQWQSEVVDPNAVTPFLLAAVGEERPVEAAFWGLTLRHFRFSGPVQERPGPAGVTFSAQANPTHPLGVNFGGQVELLGFSQPPCRPSAPEPCPLALFWRAPGPLSSDLKLTATLLDDDGRAWSGPLDSRLAAYNYPTFRWSPGVVVLGRLPLAPGLGAPPGRYRLRLDLYEATGGQPLDVLDAAGAAQGRWAWLEPVILRQLVTAGPGGPDEVARPLQAAPEIELLAASLDRAEAEPGDRLRAEVWWRAEASPGQDYQLRWQWFAPTGLPVQAGELPPGGPAFPTSQWPAGAPVRSQFDVRTPPAARPGLWRLRVGLADAAGFAGQTLDLPLEVKPSSRRFEPPAVQYPVGANLGGLVELLGVNTASEPVSPGATVPVTVVWRALAELDIAYTGSVQLLDAAGRLAAQDDHPSGATDWVAGQVIEDRYELALPTDLSAGVYQLQVTLYDAGWPQPARLGEAVPVGQVIVGD